jgi:DNA-binding response OmpR family regulator
MVGVFGRYAAEGAREQNFARLSFPMRNARNPIEPATLAEALDRIEELEHALAELTSPTPEAGALIAGVWLPKTEYRVFGTLSRGGVRSRTQLLAAICCDKRGDWPQEQIIDQYIVRLRKKLRGIYDIKNIWGVGYSMAPK